MHRQRFAFFPFQPDKHMPDALVFRMDDPLVGSPPSALAQVNGFRFGIPSAVPYNPAQKGAPAVGIWLGWQVARNRQLLGRGLLLDFQCRPRLNSNVLFQTTDPKRDGEESGDCYKNSRDVRESSHEHMLPLQGNAPNCLR